MAALDGLNWNVRMINYFMFARSAFSSLFDQTTLSYYVLLVTGSNTKVGFVQGLKGFVNLASSFPFAVLGDRKSRQLALRISGCVGGVAIVATMYVLLYVEKWHRRMLFGYLCGIQVIWGVFMGGHGATVEAVFGDSVESGKRSMLYSDKAAYRTAGNTMGPIISIVIFAALSDKWSLSNLTYVMLGGMVPAVIAVALLFVIFDKCTLGVLSESLLVQSEARSEVRPEIQPEVPAPSDAVATTTAGGARGWCLRRVELDDIPAILALSDTLSALGSGMTVKFFPLWFGEELSISPIGVMAIMLAGPVGITYCTLLAGKLAALIGRVQATLCLKGGGISLLVVLALLRGEGSFALIAIYLVRTWLMNSTVGLTKSVMNDFVSKRNRAKWNSLESLNTFSWSGSAVLGGWLVDGHGYRTTFLYTAFLQGCAAAMLLPLIVLVPVEQFKAEAPRKDPKKSDTKPNEHIVSVAYSPVFVRADYGLGESPGAALDDGGDNGSPVSASGALA